MKRDARRQVSGQARRKGDRVSERSENGPEIIMTYERSAGMRSSRKGQRKAVRHLL